jgi:excinuclease UvrABC nuclease subunit
VTYIRASDAEAPLDEVHAGAAVFAAHGRAGQPYIGRTGVLRRRLRRLLRAGIERVEYWPVASQLEGSLVLYEVARIHLPDRYLEHLKLRLPPYVKLAAANGFARTYVTTRITGGPGTYYGPFRTRAAAEQFDHELLDLFQIRRCQEDIIPSPNHPGCIYGEMGMCLRPCQEVVSPDEYASEAARVHEFLTTGGTSALHSAEAARERLSAELEFEEAARQHKRAERIREMLKLREALAAEIGRLSGVAVLPSIAPGAATLIFMRNAAWQNPIVFETAPGPQPLSLDRRLRDIVATTQTQTAPQRERQEHLAILARWYFSSWRDGAWIEFEADRPVPYRRVVSAISRIVHRSSPAASDKP